MMTTSHLSELLVADSPQIGDRSLRALGMSRHVESQDAVVVTHVGVPPSNFVYGNPTMSRICLIEHKVCSEKRGGP